MLCSMSPELGVPFLNRGATPWLVMASLLGLAHIPRMAVISPTPWDSGLLPLSSWGLSTYHLLGLSLSFGVLEVRNSALVPSPAWVPNSGLHPREGHRWPVKMLLSNCPRPAALSINPLLVISSLPLLDLLSDLHWLPASCHSQPCCWMSPGQNPRRPSGLGVPVLQPGTLITVGNASTSFNTSTDQRSPETRHSPDSPEGTTSPGAPAQKENP